MLYTISAMLLELVKATKVVGCCDGRDSGSKVAHLPSFAAAALLGGRRLWLPGTAASYATRRCLAVAVATQESKGDCKHYLFMHLKR